MISRSVNKDKGKLQVPVIYKTEKSPDQLVMPVGNSCPSKNKAVLPWSRLSETICIFYIFRNNVSVQNWNVPGVDWSTDGDR